MKGIYQLYILIDSKLPCFLRPKSLFNEIRDRISLRYNTGSGKENDDYYELVNKLVNKSFKNSRTTYYD